MALDIMAVLKALWGFATFLLLGIIKTTYTDIKKMKDRQDELEKEMIRLRSEMVTKDSLDDILDRKMKHLQETINDVRGDIVEMRVESRSEVTALRNDIQSFLRIIVEQRNK